MVINKKVIVISLALIAQPAFGFGMRSGKKVTNVAAYLANTAKQKAANSAIKPVSFKSTNVSAIVTAPIQTTTKSSSVLAETAPRLNLSEFNPLSTQKTLADKTKSFEYSINDALQKCKNQYASLANRFAEVAYINYNPTALVMAIELMAASKFSNMQIAAEIARMARENIATTIKNITEINRQLAQNLQAAGVGKQFSEYAAQLKAEAQAAIDAVQKIANSAGANITLAAQQHEKTSRGLFTATMLAGTAGYMAYEASKQSDKLKQRKTTNTLETVEIVEEKSVIEAEPLVIQTPVVDVELENAKRRQIQAEELWQETLALEDANRALKELEIATAKPVIAFKNNELAIGPVGFSTNNLIANANSLGKSIKDLSYKAKDASVKAYHNAKELACKTKNGLTDNRATNYLKTTMFGKWFGKDKQTEL